MRLSVSPATPFSVASLPNHTGTKMFELIHVVTSMNDFRCGGIKTSFRTIF